MIDGLAGTAGADDMSAADLAKVVKRLASRWFLVRNVHSKEGMQLVQPRWAMSFMRGPMTRTEIQRALNKPEAEPDAGVATAEASAPHTTPMEAQQET